MAFNPVRGFLAGPQQPQPTPGVPPQAGGGFNPNSAGQKVYGGGDIAPQRGRIENKEGYAQRDAINARISALRNHLGGA